MLLLKNPRTSAAFVHDLFAATLAWHLAFSLRFNFDIPAEFRDSALGALVWVLPVMGCMFFVFGLYRGVWRFASLSDMQRLLFAVVVGALLISSIVVVFGVTLIPRSVLVLHPLLLAIMMGGSRMAYRSWKEHKLYGLGKLWGQPVLILGAGEAADSLLREIRRNGQWYPVGILDDNLGRHGRWIHGLEINAPLDRVGVLAKKLGVSHVIIAMPSAKPSERRRAAELAVSAGLTVMTVPSYDDLLSGRLSVSSVRKVELEDLLGRDAVTLDGDGLHGLISGRIVLVSGAGGSIGAELCRHIGRFGPARVILLDSSELALYTIDDELSRLFPGLQRRCWAADIRDSDRVNEVMASERPDVVFHAAAYKHVPLMEDINAWQAVRTNSLGTLTMAKAAQTCGVKKFVLVSTDKAVNPTSVMGASKRLAEQICRVVNAEGDTHFVTVRFGNVLGSNGSVIPRFREQIARGGPVTVTHPDIVRYFMTIPEAAQLVLQAGSMGVGGEIFVLDMGEEVRIVDLARDMIRLSGFAEDEIRIEFSGLRQGEKLYEELLADSERTLETPHPKLRIARTSDALSVQDYSDLLMWLQLPVRTAKDVKGGLRHFVPEYSSPSAHGSEIDTSATTTAS